MRSYRLMLACAAMAVSSVPVSAGDPQATTGQKWAVLVGVDDYALVGKLAYCGADQRALRQRLVAAGFPEEQVFLLEDGAREARYRPSQRTIERQVNAVLGSAEEGDLVVLGFSGHGTQVDGRSYLVPGDGDPDDPATLVSLDAISEDLRRCAASVKLVIVDACRNDLREGARSAAMAAGARGLAASLEKRPLPEGVVLLTSCAPGEISWEEEKFGHGVFMNYVLEGLDGKAETDGDGSLSLNELVKYASRQTRTFVLNAKSVTQRPYLRNDGEAELLDHPLLPVPKGAMLTSLVPRPTPVGGPVKTGEVTTNSIGMQLVAIPAGEFSMGSGETTEQLKAAGFEFYENFDGTDEPPVHRVRITKAFLMGGHEVTLGEFLTFYNDGYQGKLDCEQDGKGGFGYDPTNPAQRFEQKSEYRPWSWGHPDMDFSTDAAKKRAFRHPVVNVSWNDCVAFCAWLSRKEGKKYRLPTEAEWEYACRAGTTTRFWNGDDPEGLAAIGNVADATFTEKFSAATLVAIRARDGHVFTAPVGSYPANPFGLHDMHGNVYEWCSDRYDGKYYEASPAADPKGPVSAGSFRVIRGGSWLYQPVDCRSARRFNAPPPGRVEFVGFRVVCELE